MDLKLRSIIFTEKRKGGPAESGSAQPGFLFWPQPAQTAKTPFKRVGDGQKNDKLWWKVPNAIGSLTFILSPLGRVHKRQES